MRYEHEAVVEPIEAGAAGGAAGWARGADGRAGALHGADRGAYLCVQRGGECDSFAVSVYCAAADGEPQGLSFAGDGGRGGDMMKSFLPSGQDFVMRNMQLLAHPQQGDADLFAGDAADYFDRSVSAAGGGAESMCGA